ncbi:MAG: glycosyltransferase [Actinobacteria bacterium]|nr:glycosyltransferase [Actinomycetota bacterium]
MGAINFSIDLKLVKFLNGLLYFDAFVETGTYQGDSVNLVKDIFKKIYSVELSEEFYKQSKKRFEKFNHIDIQFNTSKKFLKNLNPFIKKKSVLFWLDAHWCAVDKSAGEESQCSLIDELIAIKVLNKKSVIIIDDARLFLSPPPFPHDITHWPNFEDIIKTVKSLSSIHSLMVFNDVIIFFPKSFQKEIFEYVYNNSVDWLSIIDKSRDYDEVLLELINKEKSLQLHIKKLVEKEKLINQLSEECKKRLEIINNLNDEENKKIKNVELLLQEVNFKQNELNSFSEQVIALTIEVSRLKDYSGDLESRIQNQSQEMTLKNKKLDEYQEQINNLTNTKEKLEKNVQLFEKYGVTEELLDKEKVITALNESLTILKKRLRNPIWGILTLFQYQIPWVWELLYKFKIRFLVPILKTLRDKVNINKLRNFFTPKLGVLSQYPPKELIIKSIDNRITDLSSAPKISIVIPSYNQAEFLNRTIRSVIDQKYPNLDLIICDGGSNDGSKEIINKYDRYLTYYVSEKDNGQADAINKGFRKSSGDLMAYINSDDIYLPGAFAIVSNYFDQYPDVDVIYSHRVLIDKNDQEIGRWILPKHDNRILLWADFIPQETLFWRRNIWEKVGSSIDELYQFALDWDLLLRFQESGAKIVRIPNFLAAFRVHPDQKTIKQISSLGEEEMHRIRKKYIGRDVTYSEIKKNIFFYLIKSEILYKLFKLHLINN